jgi:hypothetical protein
MCPVAETLRILVSIQVPVAFRRSGFSERSLELCRLGTVLRSFSYRGRHREIKLDTWAHFIAG